MSPISEPVAITPTERAARPTPSDTGGSGAAEALAALQARHQLRSGIWRCRRRVAALVGQGAQPGCEDVADRAVDRALHDLDLLLAMDADVAACARRLTEEAARAAVADLAARAPLGALQRQVLTLRLEGTSWPRIARGCTRGDRGTAVRAFRQALQWLGCVHGIERALRGQPGLEAGDLSRQLGISARRATMVLRVLRARGAPSHDGSEGGAPGRAANGSRGAPPPTDPARSVADPGTPARSVRRALSERTCPRASSQSRDAIRRRTIEPNPGGRAEPCPPPVLAGGASPRAGDEPWYVLAVRVGRERAVKVELERRLGGAVRCRLARRVASETAPGVGRLIAPGYLAVSARDRGRLTAVARQLRDVLGFLGTYKADGAYTAGGAAPRRASEPVALGDDGRRWFGPGDR